MKIDYDVIIIGGGIAGIGCAAMLDPALSVLLLESESVCGYHATGRSAAIFVPSYGGAEIRQLTLMSEHYLDTAPDAEHIASYLQQRGELVLATRDENDALTQLFNRAPSLVEISIDEAVHRVPILNSAALHRVALDATARDIDVDLLLQTWRSLLLSKAGTVLNNCQVRGLSKQGSHWRVTTQQGTEQFHYHASTVVNAAGAWADNIALMAGLNKKGLTPCRRSAALIPAPGNHPISQWPCIAAVSETWYAKPSGGKLMVSPADEDPVEPHDAYAEDHTLAEGIHRYEQAVTVPVDRVEHHWAGLRTFASDRVPVVGFENASDGFFWLAGHGGYGIQTSPALSNLAARLIDGRELEPQQLALVERLSPARLD